jgi:hypothetical protein
MALKSLKQDEKKTKKGIKKLKQMAIFRVLE